MQCKKIKKQKNTKYRNKNKNYIKIKNLNRLNIKRKWGLKIQSRSRIIQNPL